MRKPKVFPCLHHDQPAALARAVHRNHRETRPPRLSAQEQARSGITSRYNLTGLVYYERFVYPDAAIAREKEIKGWRRSKKIRLIESMNPHWHDLAESWTDVYKPGIDRRGLTCPARDPSLG